MPQVFPKYTNVVSKAALLSLPLIFGTTAVSLAAFYRSDYTTGAREVVEQPVPFSHKHHVSQLGIDCRYCHTAVEKSASAGLPPTKTCMNCHQQMWVSAELLKPVRESYAANIPIEWTKVHNVPHYTYFNHSIHVNKGVGCKSCHGEIDQMNLVHQANTLLMEWCLNCHRHPEDFLRPKSEVYSMTWTPDKGSVDVDGAKIDPGSQTEVGTKLKEKYKIRGEQVITNCSICHR